MRSDYWIRLISLMPMLLVIISCSRSAFDNEYANGGGVEDGSAEISGTIVDDDGNPVEGAKIQLTPDDHNGYSDSLPEEWLVVSDKGGNFQISKVVQGDYNIQVIDSSTLNNSLVTDVILSEDKDTILKIENIVVKPSGTLIIPLQEKNVSTGYVYIPGTDIVIYIDSSVLDNEKIEITSVPESENVMVLFQSFEDSSGMILLEDSLDIISEDTLVVDLYQEWKKRKKIILNTKNLTTTIVENLIQFPILLRLSEQNFQFPELNLEGHDLRFINSKGDALSYQIEEWNILDNQISLWVLVDTVFSGNDTQFIEMLWENEFAQPKSDGKAVFDATNGFAGVWHLNEKAGTTVNGFKDMTTNANHGSGIGLRDSSSVRGIIGGGINFNGDSQAVKIGDHPSLDVSNLTLSAWIKIQDTTGRILDKMTPGVGDGYRMDVLREKLRLCRCRGVSDSISQIVNKGSDVLVPQGEFIHLAVTFNQGMSRYYKNGQLLDSTDLIQFIPLNDLDLFIGGGRNYQASFQGIIDEVRISNRRRSSDWIKLSFENQKIGSTWPAIQ